MNVYYFSALLNQRPETSFICMSTYLIDQNPGLDSGIKKNIFFIVIKFRVAHIYGMICLTLFNVHCYPLVFLQEKG